MQRRSFLFWMGCGWLTSFFTTTIRAALSADKAKITEAIQSQNTASVTFYVAPNGNDAWSGKAATPNASKTDGPFATPLRARNAIRELKSQQGGTLKQAVNVFLRGGTYFLTNQLEFTAEDSGTANFPITYSAYQEETPVISGGRRITGWKQVTVDGKRLWMAEIPEVPKNQWFFRELWINGQRATRARHPKQGYLTVAEVPDATQETPWNEGQTRFRFRDGDLKAWRTIPDSEVVVMSRWQETRLPITSVDETQNLISFSGKTTIRIDPGDLYYIEHALEILDTPEEWYLDRSKGFLYYLPKRNEDMNKAEVIAPVLYSLINIVGNSKTGQLAEHLLFQKLTFANSEWYKNSFSQGAVSITPTVYMQGCRNCVFEKCTVAHIGNYAIEMIGGCQHNRIVDCKIFDLGAGGIRIGEQTIFENVVEQTHSNEILNCHIYDGGRIYHSAVGIWIGQSYNNRIAHNHIHDFYYTGISIGWTNGYGPSLAKDNIVEFNHIHHIGLRTDGDGPLLNDKGGIYTFGVQPGTVIRSNLIHDIQAFNYGGWGIYLDEGSSQIVIENNLVYRTRDGGFHLHYGKENIIKNNIFALGSNAQIRRSAAEPHLSFTFERNIIYWSNGKLFEGNWNDSNFALDRNLYWHTGGGEIRFADKSWEEWMKRGMDKNSIIADPLFFAPENGDFRLKGNSPAFKIGFEPLT